MKMAIEKYKGFIILMIFSIIFHGIFYLIDKPLRLLTVTSFCMTIILILFGAWMVKKHTKYEQNQPFMTKETQYIISTVTTYNEWENLYETKVGTTEKNMPLHYIVCGKSEKESRERAEKLVAKDIKEVK